MKCNEQSAAAEQGNYREKNAGAQIAAPTWIGYKAKVSNATYMADAQKGPEQERSRDQDGAMKERLKTVICQEGKHTGHCKRLCRPKKNWSKQCSDDHGPDEVGRQFNYVFQGG